jgi:hypothetical protein
MFDFESKEQPTTKFWISDKGYLCIAQLSLEFGTQVIHALGPDAVELLAANIGDILKQQKLIWPLQDDEA